MHLNIYFLFLGFWKFPILRSDLTTTLGISRNWTQILRSDTTTTLGISRNCEIGPALKSWEFAKYPPILIFYEDSGRRFRCWLKKEKKFDQSEAVLKIPAKTKKGNIIYFLFRKWKFRLKRKYSTWPRNICGFNIIGRKFQNFLFRKWKFGLKKEIYFSPRKKSGSFLIGWKFQKLTLVPWKFRPKKEISTFFTGIYLKTIWLADFFYPF